MGLAAAALRDTAFTWQTRETPHVRIHFQAGSYAADHIDQFVKDAEQARVNGLEVLGANRFGFRIDVFHLTCSGYGIDEIVAFLDQQGELIPLDSLASRFRTYNDLVAYLQTGSFVGYVRATYGLAPIRALWEQGFERFETILGKTPAAMEAGWYVASAPYSPAGEPDRDAVVVY